MDIQPFPTPSNGPADIIMDRIVRQIDDAEAHAMTLLRLVVAATLALGMLGLAVHLLA